MNCGEIVIFPYGKDILFSEVFAGGEREICILAEDYIYRNWGRFPNMEIIYNIKDDEMCVRVEDYIDDFYFECLDKKLLKNGGFDFRKMMKEQTNEQLPRA